MTCGLEEPLPDVLVQQVGDPSGDPSGDTSLPLNTRVFGTTGENERHPYGQWSATLTRIGPNVFYLSLLTREGFEETIEAEGPIRFFRGPTLIGCLQVLPPSVVPSITSITGPVCTESTAAPQPRSDHHQPPPGRPQSAGS